MRVIAVLALVAGALCPAMALAQYEPDERLRQSYTAGAPDRPSPEWTLANGGRLYDNWWVTLGQDPPPGTHPAYPAAGRNKGPNSWRCSTCHGWDYRGRDGFPGIFSWAGAAPDRIAAIVRNDLHGFTRRMIPDKALERLALFVSKGMRDARQFADPTTGKAKGDVTRGRAIFQNACATCHEFDGRAQISGESADLATIGAVAARNPPQAIHKIFNGQSGADMPAMRVFDDAVIADVLSYLQTLPPR